MIRTEFQITLHIPTLFRHEIENHPGLKCRGSMMVRLRGFSYPLWRWEDEEDRGKWGEDTDENLDYDEITWERRKINWIPKVYRSQNDEWTKSWTVNWLLGYWTLEYFPEDAYRLPTR